MSFSNLHRAYRETRLKLWWRFVPGVVIKVRWPSGKVERSLPGKLGWPEFEYVASADPNDHYRPTMEQLVGRQGWDWDWQLIDNDAAENKLSIKIRQRHQEQALALALIWS